MIASLHGEISGIGSDSLVVRVGGVGLQVHVPTQLRAESRLGEHVGLHTYLVVREDSLTLFGFETEAERDFFILLLGVNGVGPRIAMAILSTLTIDAMRRAVLSEQSEIFSRVSGVGKKNAQKILLHLQGKVGGELSFEGSQILDVDTEVVEALTGLGYSVVEAQAALQSLPKDAPRDVETRLRLALQFFSS
jgi:holliday junction DNA helicase RuvA